MKALGLAKISGSLNTQIRRLLTDGWLALGLPDKPNSRNQTYKLTPLAIKTIEDLG
jgi:hypothetical protein